MIRSETRRSPCSTLDNVGDTDESLTWSLVSANESFMGLAEVSVEVGRDPSVLVIPSYTLSYAGSAYQFQLKSTAGGISNTVNVTGEYSIVDGDA